MKKLYLVLASVIILVSCSPKSPTQQQGISQPAPAPAPAPEEKKVYAVGEPMPYGNLEITLIAATGKDKLYTGNPYSTVRADTGEGFLVLTVRYENKGAEAQYVPNGIAVVIQNGQERHYESESVMDEHWGAMLKSMNPGTKFATFWGFRVPKDIQGDIYYWPENSKTAIRVGQFTSIPSDTKK